LRIGLDATPLLDVQTGVGTFVAELLQRLAVDPDLDVVAFGYTRAYLDELRRALPAGVSSTRRPIPKRTTWALWERIDWPPIERWTGPVDVVHGGNFVVPPARRGVELVTVHDLTPVRFPELCDAETVRYPRLIRRAVARGAHVHTVSRFVADEVCEAFGVARDHVHVVPNGVADVGGGDAARGRQLAGGDEYVLFVGTVEPRKDVPSLVAAFDAVGDRRPEARLVVAGRDGWGSERLDDAVGRSRHPDRVVRLGYVDGITRADLLAGAALLAYPSRYEGFGLPPLEAMAAGVPVVTTAAGAVPEVVGDAALLTTPGSVEELADALVRMLDDESLRRSLVERGRTRVSSFSWDRTATELTELYRRLANDR
jgi:glycosyltransferase involved in cell wall biosynthesis